MALVELEPNGGIALITLNRPDVRNAVTPEMTEEFRDVLRRFEADDELSVAILTGAGPFFCAGMDLAAFAAGARPGIVDPDRFAGFAAAKRTKPVIAAVNGGAIAGGFELVLACDMVVAAKGAVFGLPEVKRGLVAAGGGAFRLPRRIPSMLAVELLLTGDLIDADRAHALGLVNQVVEPEALLSSAFDLAERIAANAPLAIRETLALARGIDTSAESTGWSMTESAWQRIDGSADALEGALAFKEKRPPRWKGR